MKKHQLLWFGLILIVIGAFFFVFQNFNEGATLKEMTIPDEKLFENAPLSDENNEFQIIFSYDDSSGPVSAKNAIWKKIRWNLSIYPRMGWRSAIFTAL